MDLISRAHVWVFFLALTVNFDISVITAIVSGNNYKHSPVMASH